MPTTHNSVYSISKQPIKAFICTATVFRNLQHNYDSTLTIKPFTFVTLIETGDIEIATSFARIYGVTFDYNAPSMFDSAKRVVNITVSAYGAPVQTTDTTIKIGEKVTTDANGLAVRATSGGVSFVVTKAPEVLDIKPTGTITIIRIIINQERNWVSAPLLNFIITLRITLRKIRTLYLDAVNYPGHLWSKIPRIARMSAALVITVFIGFISHVKIPDTIVGALAFYLIGKLVDGKVSSKT